ncbi:MAG: hypothetical protein J6S71_05060 [Clostridia bacterium]|nr:hypothetical protein [Clostridia bacterium]
MNNNPFDNYRGTNDQSIRDNRPDLPMNWYKFLIWIALWISAAVNIMFGVQYISGGAQTEEMLAAFPILSTIDLFYGVLTVGMGVLALFTRFALANYKKNAPKLIVGLYAYGLVISLGYNAVVLGITSSAYEPVDLIITMMSVGTSVIINAIFVGCNYVYFKKRKRLFNK